MRPLQRASFGGRLRTLRLARGLSQIDLARLVGRHQTAIGPYERDEYEPPLDVIERLAAALETSPEYLCFGRDSRRSVIPLNGTVGAMGMLAPDPELPVALLSLHDTRLSAYRLGDDSMAPVYRAGQLVLVQRLETEPEGQLGRDAVVELLDGRRLLRRLGPGADPARFDLAAYNAPFLLSVAVRAVWPVLGALWPEAVAG